MALAEAAVLVLAYALGLCVLVYALIVTVGVLMHLAYATLGWLERKWEMRR